jgi:hypothetical protein
MTGSITAADRRQVSDVQKERPCTAEAIVEPH